MRVFRYFRNNQIPLIILGIIFCQNPIWPLWHSGFVISFILSAVLFTLKIKVISNVLACPKINLLLILLLLFFVIIPSFNGGGGSNYIYILNFLTVFTISKDEYRKTFILTSKLLGYISVFSFIPWVINTFVYPIFPLYNIIDLSSIKGTDAPMYNYFFYVKYFGLFESFRFYSVFDEPGVFGTIAAFVLFGNRYDFRKWYVNTIFFSAIFTFSLAFYTLTLIGYIYFHFTNIRKFVIAIVSSGLFLILLSYLLKYDDTFQLSIVDRISDMGFAESLDSRTGYDASRKLDSIRWTSDYFWGIGTKEIDYLQLRIGESYKLFILEYGILSLFVLFLCYFSFIPRIKKDYLFLLLLFIVSFLQRPFLFTSWQMFLFTSICMYIDGKKYKVLR